MTVPNPISPELFLLLQEMLRDIHSLEQDKLNRYRLILQSLARLENQGAKIMTAFTDINALISAIDETTNDLASKLTGIADRIQRIMEQLEGGVSASEAAQLQTRLGGEVADLQAQAARAHDLGQDPQDPIPAEG